MSRVRFWILQSQGRVYYHTFVEFNRSTFLNSPTVLFQTGTSVRDLGSCVPCECNGHSGTCDPETGVCSNCQHNTYGDNCEFCEVETNTHAIQTTGSSIVHLIISDALQEGFYGDSTSGGYYACQSCQCPFVAPNNFAFGCTASVYGEMLSCDCKPGYTGVNCERCDPPVYFNLLEQETNPTLSVLNELTGLNSDVIRDFSASPLFREELVNRANAIRIII